jgi:hypothetical protein
MIRNKLNKTIIYGTLERSLIVYSRETPSHVPLLQIVSTAQFNAAVWAFAINFVQSVLQFSNVCLYGYCCYLLAVAQALSSMMAYCVCR